MDNSIPYSYCTVSCLIFCVLRKWSSRSLSRTSSEDTEDPSIAKISSSLGAVSIGSSKPTTNKHTLTQPTAAYVSPISLPTHRPLRGPRSNSAPSSPQPDPRPLSTSSSRQQSMLPMGPVVQTAARPVSKEPPKYYCCLTYKLADAFI